MLLISLLQSPLHRQLCFDLVCIRGSLNPISLLDIALETERTGRWKADTTRWILVSFGIDDEDELLSLFLPLSIFVSRLHPQSSVVVGRDIDLLGL